MMMRDDLKQSAIPMFGKNGTALSHSERAEIAKRRGLCLTCGSQTHDVKLMGRKALTNDDIFQGTCIKCNPSAVPQHILKDWQARNAQVTHAQPMNRFRVAATMTRVTTQGRPGVPSSAVSVGLQNSSHSQQEGYRPSPQPLDRSGRMDSSHRSESGFSVLSTGSSHSGYVMPPPHQTSVSRQNSSQGSEAGFSIPSTGSTTPSIQQTTVSKSGSKQSLTHSSDFGLSNHSNASTSQHRWNVRENSTGSLSTSQSDSDDFRSEQCMHAATVMHELGSQKDKPEMARQYLHAVRNLTPGDAPMKELKAVMDMYRGNSRFMRLSVGALWGIASTSDDKKVEAVSVGCLDMILEMLQGGKTRDDADTVTWTFGALSSLARVSSNRTVILQKQGVETILLTIKRHERDSCVFEWGCRALYALVGGFEEVEDSADTSFEREITKIENDGGIRVLVGTMEFYPTESVAMCWALNVLLSMVEGQSDPDGMGRLAQMMDEEDLALVCARILKGGTSPECSMRCQEMIKFLLSQGPSQLICHAAVECIVPVVQGLIEHPQNMSLHAVSASFLVAVAGDNLEAKRQISRSAGIHVFLYSMAAAPENLALQRSITTLLWLLSADESSFDYSILRETKQAIEKAVTSHPTDKELSEAVCGYVANVASRAQGHPDCIPRENLIQLARNAGKQGNRALVAVCGYFPEVVERLLTGGMVDALTDGLRDSSPDVQASSASIFSLIVPASDAARSKVFAAGGLELASTALMVSESELMVESLLQLVMSVLSSGVASDAVKVPSGLIMAILQASTKFPKQTKLAFSTIRNILLVTSPGLNAVSTDGLMDSILRTIDAPTSPNDLVIEACGALWSFVTKQPPEDPNVLSRVVASILSLCKRHKPTDMYQSASVLAEASGALGAVMHGLRDHPILIRDDDIDLIVSILDGVLERDVRNATLIDRLMDVILSLCFSSREVLIQFGSIAAVIDSMVEHEGNEGIQEKGCTILALLASTEKLQDIQKISLADDGIDLIVSALAGFTENMVVQTNACRALSHLSIDNESRMLIASQGGPIMMVNAMNRFRDEVDLLDAACSALLNLSSDADEQILLESNVVETVVATMRLQKNSAKFQEKCLGILQNLSIRSTDCKRAIAEAGGVGAVVVAMREFMGSPSVLERCFTTLWSLAVLETNQSLIAREGGIGMVINGMMACIDFNMVQKQACGCLNVLSSDSANKAAIRDLGGVDAVVYAMWAHYKSDDVLIEACRLLATLAVTVQTNEVMIVSDGDVSAILSAMRRFPFSEHLQEHACAALRNFLLSADNVEVVRPQVTDLEELISIAASRFPGRCSERAGQIRSSLC